MPYQYDQDQQDRSSYPGYQNPYGPGYGEFVYQQAQPVYQQAQPVYQQAQPVYQQAQPVYQQVQPVYQQVEPVPYLQPNVHVAIPSYQQSAVTQTPVTEHPHNSHRALQDVSMPNINRQQVSVNIKTQPPAAVVEEFDYALWLIAVAEEYLDAAHILEQGSPEYYKIIATCLGCLESVLNNYRVPPLREARVALRYAEILFEETNNNDEIEKILTKSIEQCERNRFVDLKYTMQALLARALHRSKPKAAVKDLQSMIEDVEAYRHVAWEYNFRFLSASLSLMAKSSHDHHYAISQLEKICSVSNHHGDYAIYAFASIMQALVALHGPDQDAVTIAQRALANARQVQLNPDVEDHPQMQVLMELIDLDCSLQEGNHAQTELKLKNMQQTLYQRLEHPSWQADGLFYLPVSKRSLNGAAPQEGGTILERSGKPHLQFSWLQKIDAEVIGYLLSAASVSHKNASDGGKAEKYLSEGMKLLRSQSNKESVVSQSTSLSQARSLQHINLECCFLLEKTFLLCAKGNWAAARTTIDEILNITLDLEKSLPSDVVSSAEYLNGVISQGTGDLSTALTIFQSSTFSLTQLTAPQKTGRANSGQKINFTDTVRDLSFMAAMNSILIVHPTSHPQHHLFQTLLASIDSTIATTSNKSVQASYALIQSTLADSTILRTKQHLGHALSTAQQMGNAQITALTLILMSDKFFKGVVGDQAMKCAKAASHQARRAGDPLWISVAQGMEAECLNIMGKTDEARKIGEAARKAAVELPERVLRREQ